MNIIWDDFGEQWVESDAIQLSEGELVILEEIQKTFCWFAS